MIVTKRILLAMACVGGMWFSGVFAIAEIPVELVKSVNGLPAVTADQKLKKATLQWALEDAKAAEDAGFKDRAALTLADVRTLLPKTIGLALKAPGNLFPPIPQFKSNPIAQSAVKTLNGLVASDKRYVKGPAGDIVNDPKDGWVAIKIAYEAENLALALCHPQSPYAGDPAVIAPMFRRFENAYEFMTPDNGKRLADFGPSPALAQMYLLLNAVYPDLILPSRKVAWEKALRLTSDRILGIREEIFLAGKPGTAYVNADVKYITALAYAGLIFNEPRYTQAAEAGVRLEETAQYADGAFAYIYWQNECMTYHPIAVSEMARLWQVTGNPVARRMVERGVNYYPLSVEPAGMAEFATAPSWKHNWGAGKSSTDAYAITALTGSPLSMMIQKTYPAPGNLLAASFYRDDVKPAAMPDNYVVFDRNIEGPRGRFGAFSFCGSTRDFKDDRRGKSSYASCMVMVPAGNGKSQGLPLSAGLDAAGTEIKVKVDERAGRGMYLSLSQNERNATTVTRDFAALTTVHQLSSYGSAVADWRQQQTWLFTPGRVVGLVSAESMKDQSAFGMAGVLQFMTGKADQKFQKIDANSVKFGMATIRIHQHDYAGMEMEYPPSTRLTKLGKLVISDRAAGSAGGGNAVSYAKGAKHYYLAEIYPDWAKPAESVKTLSLDGGLVGFEVVEGGKRYRVVFNPTEAQQVYQAAGGGMDAGVQLHRSGEQYRPAWIGKDGKEEFVGGSEPITVVNNAIKITIPAGAHIVLAK